MTKIPTNIRLKWLSLPRLATSFIAFHVANPRVYRELARLAVQMRGTGRMRYSIGTLYEVLRWHRDLETTDAVFKLCNNHRAFYARLIMSREPTCHALFCLKRQKACPVPFYRILEVLDAIEGAA